jgi:type II secretory pathway pseudopilin PulG
VHRTSVESKQHRLAAWWVEILIAIAVVLVVVGIAIPAYNNKKTEARRTEAKKNLNVIQMAVERYATDNVDYPPFLLGGSAPSNSNSGASVTKSDPLLRGGYLTEYPRNPFAVPQMVKAMQEKYGDSFRPGTEQSRYGLRFGEDYCLMGQVLADFRYPKLPGQKMTKIAGVYCFLDTEYPFYDIWPPGERKPKPFLPGEFFYKSNGFVHIKTSEELEGLSPWIPQYSEAYVMGVYGALDDRGKDVLGPEPTFDLTERFLKQTEPILSPVWTRSTMINESYEVYGGSWYRGPIFLGGNVLIDTHTLEGIPDAIISVRYSGATYK